MADLSTNQRKALAAILEHPMLKHAAQACDLTPRTLRRYLNDPDFRAELRKAQGEILAQTVAAMVGGRGTALGTLRKAQADPEASWSEKIRAAHYWLAHTQDAVELQEVLERIEALELLMTREGEHGP